MKLTSDEENMDNLKEVLVSSVGQVEGYLPQLIKGLEQVCLLIRNNQINDAMNLLRQCMTGLGGFIEIVDRTNQLLAALRGPDIMKGLPLLEKRQAINDILNEILTCLKTNNHQLVGELLEDKLNPLMNEWISLFPSFIERINSHLK